MLLARGEDIQQLHGRRIQIRAGKADSPTDELPQAFEAALRDADYAADQRFEKSEAAAQLVLIGRQIGEQSDLLESLATGVNWLEEERAALNAAWTATWATTPLIPQDWDTVI